MVRYDHNCDPVEYYEFHILLHRGPPNFDSQLHIKGIVGQEVNTMDQPQLLDEYDRIQPLLQSRWYLLHRDK